MLTQLASFHQTMNCTFELSLRKNVNFYHNHLLPGGTCPDSRLPYYSPL
jgi:hypothetical protein